MVNCCFSASSHPVKVIVPTMKVGAKSPTKSRLEINDYSARMIPILRARLIGSLHHNSRYWLSD